MVGRETVAAGARRGRRRARSVLAVRGLAPRRPDPARLAPGCSTGSTSTCTRRGAGHRRPARLRPHRDPGDAVRRQRRPQRRPGRARRRAGADRLAAAGAPARAGAGDRGPQGDGALPRRLARATTWRCRRWAGSPRFGIRSAAGEARAGAPGGRPARRALHRDRAGGGDALGRQPAEGGDRQVAGHRAAGAAARRADPRHRRRRQAGDLRAGRERWPPRGWRS